jgi:hypothetical protein
LVTAVVITIADVTKVVGVAMRAYGTLNQVTRSTEPWMLTVTVGVAPITVVMSTAPAGPGPSTFCGEPVEFSGDVVVTTALSPLPVCEVEKTALIETPSL